MFSFSFLSKDRKLFKHGKMRKLETREDKQIAKEWRESEVSIRD